MRTEAGRDPIIMALAEQTRVDTALRVRLLGSDQAEESLWQHYLERTSAATIYHDVAWRKIFQTAFGYRAYLLIAENRDGQVQGLLPLYEVPGIFGKRLVSVPFRDRGGVLFDTQDAFRALIMRSKELQQERRYTSVELKTVAPYPDALAADVGLSRQDYWIHSQADLTAVADGDLMRFLGEKTRNMIRQAERAGLQCDLVDGRAGLSDWMSLHHAAQHKLGVPAFPQRFFEFIFAILGAQGKAQLFLVRDANGKPVAGSIGYIERDRFIYAYSGSTEQGRNLRANDIMLVSLLQRAMTQGLHWFDFGSDSPRQAGLLFFKRKWLAHQATIPTYRLGESEPVLRDSSSPGFEMVRKIVTHLPALPLRMMLAPMVRYLG